MFGCIGSRLEASKVYCIVPNYINGTLKFRLYPDEFTVVSSIKYVNYLETRICWKKNLKRKTLKTFALSKSYSIIPFNGPHLTVSLESLRRKIVLKKYFIRRFIYAKIVRVVSPSSIVKQDLYSIIKSFNYAVRDIVNYYSFVSGR